MKLKLKNRVVRHAIRLLKLYELESQDVEINAKQCRRLLKAARDYRNLRDGAQFPPAGNN